MYNYIIPILQICQVALNGLNILPFNQVVPGSNPGTLIDAQIAQLVEQRTENPRVVGSIPTLGIVLARVHLKCFWNFLCGCSSMVEH